MPRRAPVFGKRAAAPPPKAWQKPRDDGRLRGRPGMRMREQVRREEPFCRACLAKGLHVATDDVDHIVPLSQGGTNDRRNMQGLCAPCHRVKSKAEAAAGRRAARA